MSFSRVRHIFTYGTLMSACTGAQGAAEREMLEQQARCIGPARLRGRIYDAGLWPGAVLTGAAGDRVHGEVWELPADNAGVLSVLDAYEGCGKESRPPYPYRRVRIRVRTPDGRRVVAWMYVWAQPTRGLSRVRDGRWRERAVPAVHAIAACEAEPKARIRRGRLQA